MCPHRAIPNPLLLNKTRRWIPPRPPRARRQRAGSCAPASSDWRWLRDQRDHATGATGRCRSGRHRAPPCTLRWEHPHQLQSPWSTPGPPICGRETWSSLRLCRLTTCGRAANRFCIWLIRPCSTTRKFLRLQRLLICRSLQSSGTPQRLVGRHRALCAPRPTCWLPRGLARPTRRVRPRPWSQSACDLAAVRRAR